MTNNYINAFELRLIVIAILLPMFFDTFPNLINEIPLSASGFKLLLPQISSIFIGVFWFTTLVIGLLNLFYSEKIGELFAFQSMFRLSTISTILGIGFVIFSYLGYTIYSTLGKNISMTLGFILLIVIVILIYLTQKDTVNKNVKNKPELQKD